MRVGIITFHNSYNFGSALQAYALQYALQDLGHDAVIIDFYSQNFDQYLLIDPRHPRHTLRTLERFPRYLRRQQSFRDFSKSYFNLTPSRYSWKDEGRLDELQTSFDAFVCGSDQIWNLDATKGIVGPYFLSFAGERRRIAYGPSLAHTSFLPEFFDRRVVAELLGEFYALSVRERETIGLFQSLVDKEIQVVVDPTLLVDANAFGAMAAKGDEGGDYIFLYMPWGSEALAQSAATIAEKNNIRVVYVYERDLNIANAENRFGIGPEEFVSLIAHADAVLTNSFHATVFSLKFHKPFRVISIDGSGSRMRDLLGQLDLGNFYSEEKCTEPIGGILWEEVDQRIESLREDSLRFLGEALS